MKKIALILMICIYALSILGIGIKQFYCCGILQSTTISFVHESKDKCAKDNEMSGCCKTIFKSFQVKDTHIAADAVNNPTKHFSEINTFIPTYESIAFVKQSVSAHPQSHAPPLYSGTPIYMLNCTYRI